MAKYLILLMFLVGCNAKDWYGESPDTQPTKVVVENCVCDLDGNGLVSRDELREVTSMMLGMTDFVRNMEKVDLNNNGVIDDSEFAACSVNEISSNRDGKCTVFK